MGDDYGYGRMPASLRDGDLSRVERIPYGRFRNVYVYITEACQLRCKHCYMGDRLHRALRMPYDEVIGVLRYWRRMGGNKLTILGGEPTVHPRYGDIIRAASSIGYEHVITTTNGLASADRALARLEPEDFAYVQISLDGGSASSHDAIRGQGTFDRAMSTMRTLTGRGFDTRIICTVNGANQHDCMNLMSIADDLGVSLVKFHVFSTIGLGGAAADIAMTPAQWISFYRSLEERAKQHKTRVWYQPTYAYRGDVGHYVAQGFSGCIGRSLDRISVFPDGRCYVCSYLFDTDYHFGILKDGRFTLNRGANEVELFNNAELDNSCQQCAAGCQGGCPAEAIAMGSASCEADPRVVPVCRLWKAEC